MIIEQLDVSQELVSVLYYNFSNPRQLYLDVLKLVFWSPLNFFSQNSGGLLHSSWWVFFSFTHFIFCASFYILFGFNKCLIFFYFKKQTIGFLYKSSQLLKQC